MARYLITGGAGFIGSQIAARLMTGGDEVVVIDNLKTGTLKNVPKGAEFIEADIRDLKGLQKLDSLSFDAVLHLAAQSSGEISHDDPYYDLDTNARGTLNMLRWAQQKSITRFLNASSMGVYGEVAEELCPVKEDANLNPLSFYGVSKLAGEKYANYFMSKGMKITSFRMFNVYGPGQNLENMKQGMVSIYMKFILNGEPVVVKGSKDRFRDLIFIDDVVEAWVSSINNVSSHNRVYNLGTGTKTHVYQIVDMLLESFGKKLGEYPVQYVGSTPADQFGIYADITKIRRELNWNPAFSIKSGFAKLAEFYG